MSTFLITGANRGIGFAITTKLAAASSTGLIIACARTPAKATELNALAEKSSGKIVVVKMDTSSQDSMKAAIEEIKKIAVNGINCVYNNAGIYPENVSILSEEAPKVIMDVFQTNMMGPLILTGLVAPLLAPFPSHPSHSNTLPVIINISSICGCLSLATQIPASQDEFVPIYANAAYSLSKMGLNAVGLLASRQLKDKAIIGLLHPGFVATDMTAVPEVQKFTEGMITTDESSAGCIKALNHLTKAEDTGKYFNYLGEKIEW